MFLVSIHDFQPCSNVKSSDRDQLRDTGHGVLCLKIPDRDQIRKASLLSFGILLSE